MSNQNLNNLLSEDEDIVLEGSELHQTLKSMGYTDYNCSQKDQNSETFKQLNLNKMGARNEKENVYSAACNFYENLIKDYSFRKSILNIILESNILLDDHAASITDLFEKAKDPLCLKIIQSVPLLMTVSNILFRNLLMKKQDLSSVIVASLTLSFCAYKRFVAWSIKNSFKKLISLQNELHTLSKQGLNIVRRVYGKKMFVKEINKNSNSLGSEKESLTMSIMQILKKGFEKLSSKYYNEAQNILHYLPKSLKTTCVLTNVKDSSPEDDNILYDTLKNKYYTYIVIQSESMYIIANAFNGTDDDKNFSISYKKLKSFADNIASLLKDLIKDLSQIVEEYDNYEIQLIKREFRGSNTSKWQDVYLHLELTSNRIQQAYKHIVCILDAIDKTNEDEKVTNLITDKVNELYKEIEMAKNFTEFSTLLVAKSQRKKNNATDELENTKLLPNSEDSQKVLVICDKEPEIEDEVFEEYIKEEYLKPLSEGYSKDVIQNFKLDKLLKKNFMSELKEALIEKQKEMNEREFKALKRMYNNVRDSQDTKNESFATVSSKENSYFEPPISYTPKLLPPPPIPSALLQSFIDDPIDDENFMDEAKTRTPVPLPRVKMYQPNDEIFGEQRLSIKDYQNPQFNVPFQITEDMFIGSGENSEEEV